MEKIDPDNILIPDLSKGLVWDKENQKAFCNFKCPICKSLLKDIPIYSMTKCNECGKFLMVG